MQTDQTDVAVIGQDETALSAWLDLKIGDLQRKEIRQRVATMSPNEVTTLVSMYYQQQRQRIRAKLQGDAVRRAGGEPFLSGWMSDQFHEIESRLVVFLDEFAKRSQVGRWSLAQCGIGPVFAAGLVAHLRRPRRGPDGEAIEVDRDDVSRIWSYAGMGTHERDSHKWNRDLRKLCWLISESFVKSKGRESSYYGPLYDARRKYEDAMNDAGRYRERALKTLEDVPTHAQKGILSQGKLTDGHLHERCKRWTVKLFLSHWHAVDVMERFGRLPKSPFALHVLGHRDYVPVPNWPWPDSPQFQGGPVCREPSAEELRAFYDPQIKAIAAA